MARCAICGKAISAEQPAVGTTLGEQAHITCADQEALTTYQRRTRSAVASAVFLIALIVLLRTVQANSYALILASLSSAILHGVCFHRWWWLTISMLYQRRR